MALMGVLSVSMLLLTVRCLMPFWSHSVHFRFSAAWCLENSPSWNVLLGNSSTTTYMEYICASSVSRIHLLCSFPNQVHFGHQMSKLGAVISANGW